VQGKNMGGDKYKLNIHEHSERGDNATAKTMQGSVKSFKDIKNSVF
jgi:complex III assembly factor LYRM7